jgi:polysaccharide biosynthesis protein PslH
MQTEKVLYAASFMPYPCNSGGKLRTWANLLALREHVELTAVLFAPAEEPVAAGDLDHIRRTLGHVELIRLPGVDKSLGAKLGRRLNSMLPSGILQRFLPFLPEFRRILSATGPDRVVLEFPLFGAFIDAAVSSGAAVMVEEPNIHTFTATEGVVQAPLMLDRIRYLLDIPALYGLERDAFRRAGRVWVTSDEDAARAKRLFGGARPLVIPNVVDVNRHRPGAVPDAGDHSIVYVGSFHYPPNVKAAEVLIQGLFPAIQSIYPGARLYLVGRDPTAGMLEAGKRNPAITVTGSVPDAAPYLARASVAVIPLYHGGGTRLKALEAWAMGKPVVSTYKGVEGLHAIQNVHYLRGETVAEMAAAVRRIWETPGLGQQLASHGRQLVERRYSSAALSRTIRDGLNQGR